MGDFFPPLESVRGMKSLDKGRFSYQVTVPALQMLPRQCTGCLQRFKKLVLKQTGVKRFLDGQDDKEGYKNLLMSPGKTASASIFSPNDLKWLEDEKITMATLPLTLTYDNFSMSAILRAVLPAGVTEVPSAFEAVGHIAHLNLRADVMEYKTIIGEVLLDRHKNILTVVNKVDSIDTSFRFFKMELLAGEDRMVTRVKENDCMFELDFSKVYWNSRLHTEHQRVAGLLGEGQLVADMFAGVGPFAIPAGKKGCRVMANDLNPASYQHLRGNITINKLEGCVTAYNLDGREFVKQVFSELVKDPKSLSHGSHVIMNLPALAIEFLDSLKGILVGLPPEHVDSTPLPYVHCYTFSKSATPTEDVVERAESVLECSLPPGSFTVERVRDVAPNKLMMRLSFQLPQAVAMGTTKQGNAPLKRSPPHHQQTSPPSKRDCPPLDQPQP